jgi:O-antigen/teichoic acid export membrane protein
VVATQPREQLRRQIGVFTTLGLMLVIPLCAGSFAVGSSLIKALFGPGYESAGLYFKLLMLSVACAGVDANIGQVLLAIGEQRSFAVGVSMGGLANIVLNLMLIPPLGPTGSAIATIVAEAMVLVFMTFRLRAVIGMPTIRWSRVVAASVSSLLMTLTLVFVVDDWPVLPRIMAGVGVFFVGALASGAMRPADYRRLYGAATVK